MINDILILQKRELDFRLKEKYIDRGINETNFNSDIIKVIMGPRRAGKSFFAINILTNLDNFGYVNFDDEQLINISNYNEIIDQINIIYSNPKILLFDEIQNLKNWELFVNRLQRQGFNLIITGSNSKLLSRELSTHLTGRHKQIIIFPFSFKEYLFIKKNKQDFTENEKKLLLNEYLETGGYPEVIIKNENKIEYLSNLFNSIIFKDIIKRYNIRSVQGIEDLAIYLLSNVSKEFSYNSLMKIIKCKSVNTVEKYLQYLEETFLFFVIKKFSYKYKEISISNKKIFCIDSGLIQTKAFKSSPNFGALFENIVAITLKKLEEEHKINFYFWKNSKQEEVDFVIKKGLKIEQLIQVCYNVNNIKTYNREIRSLLKAGKELNCNNLLIITDDLEKIEKHNWYDLKGEINFIPLWKWLLMNKI